MGDHDSGQPDILPWPNLPALNRDNTLTALNEGLKLSPIDRDQPIKQLLLNSFTNHVYGLERTNRVIHHGVRLITRSIDKDYSLKHYDVASKAGAFVRGARIGNFVVAAHFDFNPPTLTDEICAKYDIRIPTEEDASTSTLGLLNNSSLDDGHQAFIHFPWLDECIDILGGEPAGFDPNMARAGVGYVIHLIRFASGFVQYLAAQQELERLEKQHPNDFGGVFGLDFGPEDFIN